MVQNNDIHICPICGFANESAATRCGKCGVAVTAGTTTVNVPDDVIDLAVETQHFEAKHRSIVQDGIVLYIAGETQPLILRGKSTIILGRQIEGEPANVIDTTPYYGHLLGVSRQHAEIVVTADGCTLEDLGSTNGTFLNEKRLLANTPYLIHNGDQIRLGQLIMFVYFSSASTRQQLTFKPVTAVETLLGPRQSPASYLAATISPHLDVLLTLQQMVDGLLQRSATEVSINMIQIDATETSIEVDLEGALDALQLVLNVLIPWQKEHPAVVAELRGITVSSAPAPAEDEQAAVPEPVIADNQEVPAEEPVAVEMAADEQIVAPEPVTADNQEVPAEEPVVVEPAEAEETVSPVAASEQEDAQAQLAQAVRQHLMNGQPAPDAGQLAAYEDQMLELLKTLTASPLEITS